jgi:hypothetical protein
MSTIRSLMAEAQRLGVTVQLAFLDGDLWGLYDHDAGMITVDLTLTLPQLKETLGHELGHCFHSDICSSGPNERRADRYAARLLIDPFAYRNAELRDPRPASIAIELGQTCRMVRVFQREWLPALALSRRLRAG